MNFIKHLLLSFSLLGTLSSLYPMQIYDAKQVEFFCNLRRFHLYIARKSRSYHQKLETINTKNLWSRLLSVHQQRQYQEKVKGLEVALQLVQFRANDPSKNPDLFDFFEQTHEKFTVFPHPQDPDLMYIDQLIERTLKHINFEKYQEKEMSVAFGLTPEIASQLLEERKVLLNNARKYITGQATKNEQGHHEPLEIRPEMLMAAQQLVTCQIKSSMLRKPLYSDAWNGIHSSQIGKLYPG